MKTWILMGTCVLATLPAPAEAQRRRGIPITLESTPPGAAVHLGAPDGEVLGTTPLRNVRVARGEQDLYFTLAGYQTHRERVTVRRRRARTAVTLVRESRLVVSSAGASAAGGTVSVDGEQVGAIPHEMVVEAGRHLVQVEREGYVTFSQWVDVAQGEGITLPVLLEREPPRAGSILIAGGVPGSQIFIDGEERGTTPMVVEGIAEGAHTIEIRAEGQAPYSEQVVVRAGQRSTLTPNLRARASGVLTIVADADGAVIRVDGEVLGASPVTVDQLAAGEHIVEASAPGRQAVTRTVTVEAGQRRAMNLELPLAERAPGRLVINGGVAGATVTVDGEARGGTPLVLTDLAAGPHAVIIEADGYDALRTTCEVRPERDCVIEANLRGRPTPVTVSALGVRDAELWLDGERVGPVPFEGALPSGSHRFEVRAPGFDPHVEQVMLTSSAETRAFEISLEREGARISEEERDAADAERERLATAAVSHGAAPLPVGLAAIDASVGFPHLVEARLGVGLLDWLDAGFAIRTFGRLTEFEARGTIGFRPIDLLGVGGRVRTGGGIGPDDVNSFFLSVEAVTTLYFGGHGGFTLWVGVDGHTDQYDFQETDSSMPIANPGDRQDMIRVRLGGSIEWSIERHWGLWGDFEGILASTGAGRRVFGDLYGTGNSDLQVFFRLGGTYKF